MPAPKRASTLEMDTNGSTIPNFRRSGANRKSTSTVISMHGVSSTRSEGGGKHRIRQQTIAGISVVLAPEDYDLMSLDDPEGLSVHEVICNLVIACVGCAVAVFPRKMQDAGYVLAVPLLGLGCFCCNECGILIAEGCTMGERLLGDDGKVNDYEKLAYVAGGAKIQGFLALSKNAAMLGFVIVFMQFVTDSFASYLSVEFRQQYPDIKGYVRFLITLPLHVAMTFIVDLKQLARFNSLGVGLVAAEIFGLLGGALLHRMYGHTCATAENRKLAKICAEDVKCTGGYNTCIFYAAGPEEGHEIELVGSFLASAVFAFAVLATIPSLRSQMQESSRMPQALSKSLAIVFCMYSAVMVSGYIGYGEAVAPNLAEALSVDFPLIGMVTSTAILGNCLISAPFFIYIIMNSFENLGESVLHTSFTVPNTIFRMSLMVVLCVLGYMAPNIGAVISLVSAVFCVCNNIFLPIMFFYYLRKQLAEAGKEVDPLSNMRFCFHIAVLIVGAFTMVFGVKGGLAELLGGPDVATAINGTSVILNTTTPILMKTMAAMIF